MATANLSEYDKNAVPSAAGMRIGIVVAEWNGDITSGLLEGARAALLENGASDEHILVKHVPGSYELPMGAQYMIECADVEVIICLGCVIQGETRHFEFICQAVAQGVKDVSLRYGKPVIFGVLTDNNKQQSIDRSGGKYGNKGTEAAITAIKMAALKRDLQNRN